ncbi:hypothetical protein SAMN05421736_11876 [Evansella caseinilytica]|uniref:CYTH domain-containing protein n=1 Tax=Evansella caseinilytica TaxID=1503961 RepID=A0A1H3U5C8_9BACI|nr:hypothetical protein [Evansella caseinilytica]SDZ57487.1 hypothetical protein SAMN05421736_11876 [Evansella caseinilytica]
MKKGFTLRTFLLLAVFLVVGFTGTLAVQSSSASDNPPTPGYEVKLFLDPDVVLDQNNTLKKEVRNTFETGKNRQSFAVQYLDTSDLQMMEEGWSVRIRKREDQGTHRIQYKKRYPIIDGNVQEALAAAARDGFTRESGFEAEIDWGYSSQTLSFAITERENLRYNDELQMPDLEASRQIAQQHAPAIFTNWLTADWGAHQLAQSKIYGVVDFVRYTGTLKDVELAIEIWKVIEEGGPGYEYLVEASFKTDNESIAGTRRAELLALLSEKGWLIPHDVLKTKTILDRY